MAKSINIKSLKQCYGGKIQFQVKSIVHPTGPLSGALRPVTDQITVTDHFFLLTSTLNIDTSPY